MASANATKCLRYLSESDVSQQSMLAWAVCKLLAVGGTDVDASAVRPGADVVAQYQAVVGADHKSVTDLARAMSQVDYMVERGM
jgi:hypothetical protein